MDRCGLDGKPLSTRTERFRVLLTTSNFFTGELPKQLPVSLEVLDLSGGSLDAHKFTGGIPFEWGALTNHKTLSISNCSLDGKSLSTRTERLRILLTVHCFSQEYYPSNLPTLSI